jgi:nitrate/nitrite transporter NarK
MDFVHETFRVYGAFLHKCNDNAIFFANYSFIRLFFRPLWGYFVDKLQNFKIFNIMCFISIIYSIILINFMQSNLIYIIHLLVGMIVKDGINSSIFPHIMKIYGMKYCV